jgi:hypothetical protein
VCSGRGWGGELAEQLDPWAHQLTAALAACFHVTGRRQGVQPMSRPTDALPDGSRLMMLMVVRGQGGGEHVGLNPGKHTALQVSM